MPDWSYHTLFRPIFFQLTAERSRSIALGAIGTLARFPAGTKLIDLMGHMMPPQELARSLGPLRIAGPVGLGAGLDLHMQATAALDRFGFGFLEIGPVTLQPQPFSSAQPILRRCDQQAIVYPNPLASLDLLAASKQLDKLSNTRGLLKPRPLTTPLFGTIGHRPGVHPEAAASEQSVLMQSLAPHCSAFLLDTRFTFAASDWSDDDWQEYFALLRTMLSQASLSQPRFLSIPPDLPWPQAARLVTLAMFHGFTGIALAGGCLVSEHDQSRLFGRPAFAPALQMVRNVRAQFGDALPIIAGGGVIEPEQALQLLASGANALTLHSGLVYSGPGLAKRINEAIRGQPSPDKPVQPNPLRKLTGHPRDGLRSLSFPCWLAGMLLGCGMMIAGVFAWIIALTVVVLPYDEAFLGMSGSALHHLNDRLLHFLSHDRISLAGTMISIGVLYAQLSYWGLRRNEHWTWSILLTSGAFGFASLFYFWGFGYFDPVHALLSLTLFPFFLYAVSSRPSAPPTVPLPDLRNDIAWRAGLWGQLCFIVIGCGLLGAGVIISLVGMTRVFVPEDLVFMETTADLLRAAHPRLLPLIAHDRAGFGGALIADGLAVLLLSLWGFRRGSRWLWWTLLCAGVPGFLSGIGIHFMVGYVDGWHLFPAYVAAAMFAAGLWCSYGFLFARR